MSADRQVVTVLLGIVGIPVLLLVLWVLVLLPQAAKARTAVQCVKVGGVLHNGTCIDPHTGTTLHP